MVKARRSMGRLRALEAGEIPIHPSLEGQRFFIRPDDRASLSGVEIGVAFSGFPTVEAPSEWRAMLADYGELPIPLYEYLPADVRAKAKNNIGSLIAWAQGNVEALWFKINPAAKAKQKADAADTLRSLEQWRALLDVQRAKFAAIDKALGPQAARRGDTRPVVKWPAWAEEAMRDFNAAHTAYLRTAALVYGNAFPIDPSSGKPILPSGMQAAVAAVGALRGLPVSSWEGTEADGIALGAAISRAVRAERASPYPPLSDPYGSLRHDAFAFGGKDDDDLGSPLIVVAVIVGAVALTIVGLAVASAMKESARAAVQISADKTERLKTACAADPATCGESFRQQASTDIPPPGPGGDLLSAAEGLAIGATVLVVIGGIVYTIGKKTLAGRPSSASA